MLTGRISTFAHLVQQQDLGTRLFTGLDVSQAKTTIRVVGEHGKIVKRAQVARVSEAPGQDGPVAGDWNRGWMFGAVKT